MKTLEEKKQILLNFSGPMSAVATPYNSDGVVEVEPIEKYAIYLAEIGVKGVYILGTTGESYSLTLDEKIQLVQAWRVALDKVNQSMNIKLVAVVNVSATCVNEIHRLAKEVERLEFDGVALLPPIYYQTTSKDHLVAYIKQILQQSAQNTPFLYYHIPSFTGELKFELEAFLDTALKSIPQLCALKFTDVNIIRFASIQNRFGDRIRILAGFDEILLPTNVLNCKGAICATFSFKSSLDHYWSIVKAIEIGNMETARQNQQAIAVECEQLRKNGNFFDSLKARLNELTQPRGFTFGTPRSPIVVPVSETAQNI